LGVGGEGFWVGGLGVRGFRVYVSGVKS